ncbi:MAG: cytochrome C oxidase subunit II [Gemmatimonadota bacterium]|nr:cytochrome C oxidase subunit II [Gemmatimonadota bacterium]
MHHTGFESAQGVWWKPAHKSEKIWVAIAFAWCMVLFAMMPLWHLRGGQNPSGIRARVEPVAFQDRVNEFVAEYGVTDANGSQVLENGIPVVQPPPGSDVYMMGRMWAWTPVLFLEKNAQYTLHLSSFDVNHGFNLYPFNVNFQVVPGYDYGLRVTPTQEGEFRIVCNEFCGIGHHLMIGRIFVEDTGLPAPGSEGGAQ